jgi:glycosyltransferase involved in cell wall biosynthesis
MTPISAVIITKNQEQKIGPTIDALKMLTDDIVVVLDTDSTDQTEAVASQKGTRIFKKEWAGYSLQKNFGNRQAKHNWILSIDDDEVISEELAASIKLFFVNEPAYDAFDLPFRTVFCGQRIKFGGWSPESHVRLFDKTKIEWNTDAVHEGLTLKPEHQIKKLSGYVYHYTVDSVEQFYAKTDRYSTLFAKKGASFGKKAPFYKIYLSPIFRFMAEYIFRLGFLDGRYGLIIAKDNARYTYLKYKKLNHK